MIEELKNRIGEMKQDNQEDEQAFKTKMAHLHHADIESLRSYYENQLAAQLLDLENREQIIR